MLRTQDFLASAATLPSIAHSALPIITIHQPARSLLRSSLRGAPGPRPRIKQLLLLLLQPQPRSWLQLQQPPASIYILSQQRGALQRERTRIHGPVGLGAGETSTRRCALPSGGWNRPALIQRHPALRGEPRQTSWPLLPKKGQCGRGHMQHRHPHSGAQSANIKPLKTDGNLSSSLRPGSKLLLLPCRAHALALLIHLNRGRQHAQRYWCATHQAEPSHATRETHP
jgi:hypothetical protein